MPRYGTDTKPSAVSVSNFIILSPGEYELVLKTQKPFVEDNKKNKDEFGNPTKNYGVRLFLQVATPGEFHEKSVSFTCFEHSEGGQSISKRLKMAFYGFNPANKDDEKKFNELADTLDWSYDTDSGELGDGWKNMSGKRVLAIVSTKPNANNPLENQQDWKAWLPLL